MKGQRTLAVTLGLLTCSSAHAASLSVVNSGGATRSVYLDGAADNGAFVVVIFKATKHGVDVTLVNAAGQQVVPSLTWITLDPAGIGPFANLNTGLSAGVPRPAGQPFTFINRMLDADPTDPDVDGGLGWTVLGVVQTANELSFTGGPLGASISTANQPNGRLFLANLHVPEPSAVLLAATIMLGATGLRCRVVNYE